MKNFKSSVFSIILILLLSITGCFLDSGSSKDDTPIPPAGNGTLEVNTIYNGSEKTDGTGKIFVYVFSTLDTAQSTRIYEASTDSEATIGASNKITISNMAAGNYFVLVFYDYKHHNQNDAGNSDPYILYNNTPLVANATSVSVSDGNTTTLTGISFGDAYKFGSSGSYVSGTGTLQVTATYSGSTGGSGTGNIYAYVFSSLDTTAQNPIYQGSTSTLSSGFITIPNIAIGYYYVVLFYDDVNSVSDIAGVNDPYVIYDSAQFAGDASQVTISASNTTPITVSFTGANKFDTGGAFNINSGTGTLVANVTYNGTAKAGVSNVSDGTGQIYIYLYSTLTNAQTAPLYSATTTSEATVGTEYTLTISDVPVGSYKLLVFYDYRHHNSGPAGNSDRYLLYNNTQYAISATSIAINNGSTETLNGISFDDTYKLSGGAAFIQPGAVQVSATYNGTAKAGVTNVSDGTGQIYVYLYSTLTNAQTAPLFSASTATEASVGTEYTINVTDVPAGNYYVLIFYDYRHHNSGPAGNTDRYELYNNTGSTGSASQLTVADGAIAPITGVVFDNTWTLSGSGAYQP